MKFPSPAINHLKAKVSISPAGKVEEAPPDTCVTSPWQCPHGTPPFHVPLRTQRCCGKACATPGSLAALAVPGPSGAVTGPLLLPSQAAHPLRDFNFKKHSLVFLIDYLSLFIFPHVVPAWIGIFCWGFKEQGVFWREVSPCLF